MAGSAADIARANVVIDTPDSKRIIKFDCCCILNLPFMRISHDYQFEIAVVEQTLPV